MNKKTFFFLDKKYLEHALNPKDLSTGLKFIIPPTEDLPQMIRILLMEGLIVVKSRHGMQYLENDEFTRLHKISHDVPPTQKK